MCEECEWIDPRAGFEGPDTRREFSNSHRRGYVTPLEVCDGKRQKSKRVNKETLEKKQNERNLERRKRLKKWKWTRRERTRQQVRNEKKRKPEGETRSRWEPE